MTQHLASGTLIPVFFWGGVHSFSPRGAHITGPGGTRAEPVNTLIVGIQDGTMPAREKGNEWSLHLNAAAQFSSTIAFSY